MIIDIFQDTICPWCRIGKKHLFDALKKWESDESITIRYRSFILDPTVPKEGMLFSTFMEEKMGGPERAKQMTDHVTKAGKAAGITFNFDRVEYRPNTLASHLLLKLASPEKTKDMVDAIYKAYFEDGLDIGNVDILVQIAKEQGMNDEEVRTQILAETKREEVEADVALAQELQITSVPFFVIDGKIGLAGAHPAETFLKALHEVGAKL
jgi:predicted DsbA family dithiol-disulfide isomerase